MPAWLACGLRSVELSWRCPGPRPVRALGPLEADPPLVIDEDAVLAFAVRAGAPSVAGQPVEPFFSLPCETGELLDPARPLAKRSVLASR